ncbi:MAG: EF-P lysine aminoacylase GenX [Deltaproteobacteria bacterium]|nr:EF-P lysine aminoacylase GenX [Deltaproteobacteria bacterium]
MLDLSGLQMRAALFRLIRSFFFDRGFLEVDTPLLQPVFIPESTIIPFSVDSHYLQTSPELCMKRLLAAGCTKLFQICPCFRKEEAGRLHQEEFTMLEWYRTESDYLDLMTDCENLLRYLVPNMESAGLNCDGACSQQLFPGIALDLSWTRISVTEAFDSFSPMPLAQALEEEQFDRVLVEFIEPHLGFGRPAFLYDYPVELASLAKCRNDDPGIAERFELYINGVELANGFSELTDSGEQRTRFVEEIRGMEKEGRGGVRMPDRFLDDLQHLDCAAGIALGLDRLFMLLMGYNSLAEAVTFCPGDF